MTPETVAQASLLFSAAEAPFTRKNSMFRAIPNIQIPSMMCESEAFVQGFLQIPKSWRCKKREASARGFRQIPRDEAVRTCLQRSRSNAQSVLTDAKHNSTASSKKRTSHLKPSVTLRARNRRASEPTFLRSGSSVYSKKHNVSCNS